MGEQQGLEKALPPHALEALFTEQEVTRRVQELGAEITRDYADANTPLLLLGVLKGATLFLSDLARAIRRSVELDFVALSSYGSGTETSGKVQMLKDFRADVSGKHVLIVEDIVDTGLTLHCSGLLERLGAEAISVKVCALLDKPSRRRAEVAIAYCGFVIEDKFVVGYGLDYAEKYRNLPYIGAVTHAFADNEETPRDPALSWSRCPLPENS